MWPFTRSDELSFRRIDADFAVGGQVQPADIDRIKAAGFRSILCARPDQEEPGQPAFGLVSQAAEQAGLEALHIPVSGQLTEGALIRMEQALDTLPRPIFGYCRSGARAGSLYAAVLRARQ
ncbi:MAG: TIGR01244 family phosphatase [Devosia sp.]|uniref:TIGR01244 family sulfur transferase n=1 Tax=Devosia sp. TaxID=1871048 RepID=UPI001A6287ED|nr:TIGR01244 family sulfur transferase [Devosia sp.]MBL8596612.1 TIGR01244 family phosphatase [Devosia sp.]